MLKESGVKMTNVTTSSIMSKLNWLKLIIKAASWRNCNCNKKVQVSNSVHESDSCDFIVSM